jgi:hypothetical protein
VRAGLGSSMAASIPASGISRRSHDAVASPRVRAITRGGAISESVTRTLRAVTRHGSSYASSQPALICKAWMPNAALHASARCRLICRARLAMRISPGALDTNCARSPSGRQLCVLAPSSYALAVSKLCVGCVQAMRWLCPSSGSSRAPLASSRRQRHLVRDRFPR